jgi:hypothetical protein
MAEQQHSKKVSKFSEYFARNNNKLKTRLKEQSHKSLTHLIKNMLDKADDMLFGFSSKADSDRSQQTYLDAMREVRLKRSAIEQGFSSALNQSFEDFENDKELPDFTQDGSVDNSDSMALVDDDRLEESMAIVNMAEKVDRLIPRELYEVKARIKSVYQCKDSETDIHPLSPVTLANAFAQTFNNMDIEIHVKLIIYKLFDLSVMNNLGNFYKEINSLLIEENILPRLAYNYKRNKNKVSSPSGYAPRQQDDGLSGHLWDTVGTAESDLNSPGYAAHQGQGVANNLMSTNFGLQGFTPAPAQMNGTINTLTAMQNYISDAGIPDDFNPAAVGSSIIQGIQRLGFSSVRGKKEMDEQIINMVSMIFDFILEDKALPSSIKALLTQLQIPYLKLALIDSSFLKSSNHPARALLNDMGKAAIGWNDKRDQNDIYLAIESVVNRILNDYQQDVVLFNELHKEFLSFWHDEESHNRSYEERIWKTTEGKERVQYAKKRVDAWVHMWCSQPETRKQIATFLKHFWKNTMLYCMHKYGEDSREWKYYIKIIHALIWSTKPNKSSSEVKQLIQMTPLLIRGLNRGMLAVGTHPNTISNIFREISKCHLEIIEKGLAEQHANENSESGEEQSHDADIAEDAIENIQSIYEESATNEFDKPDLEVDAHLEILVEEVSVEDSEPEKIIEEEETLQDEYFDTANALEYGDWVEFKIEDKCLPAKLAWKSSITTNHLFVGRDGTRVTEVTLAELAEALRTQQATLIDKAPLFDRALLAVSENIEISTENVQSEPTVPDVDSIE